MIFNIIAIGLGLSMDAAAVSVTDGLCYPDMGKKKRFFIPLVFGLLQGAMLLIGMLAGSALNGILGSIGGYVAFAVLLIIGAKMLYDGFKKEKEEEKKERLSVFAILLQGLATSVDAAAAGLGTSAVLERPLISSLIVAAITFSICLAAVLIGKKAGGRLKEKAVIIGGLILIAIAVKILAEQIG